MHPGAVGRLASAVNAPILDIEASSFGAGSYPIEVGWVLADGRSRRALIRPRAGRTRWNPRAEAWHGIGRETLRQPGVDRHRASGDARALQLAIEQAAAEAAP